jgi:hypothetical protein
VSIGLPELLDCLAKRPHMFVHPVTFATVQGYLRGLSAGLRKRRKFITFLVRSEWIATCYW